MDDPLARQALNRVLAQRTVVLREMLQTIEPETRVSRSVEEAVDAVLASVVLVPLVLDVAALIGPERTESGAWLWAAPLMGELALSVCLPLHWFTLPLTLDAAEPPALVFIYDDDGLTEDDAWRLFQSDWRDALAWIASVDGLIQRAARRWRLLATQDITTRLKARERPNALTSPCDNL